MFKSLQKLNLGSGPNGPEGWINLDGSWNAWLAQYPCLRKLMRAINLLPKHSVNVSWGRGIVIHDVRKPLPFPNCSMEAIYASHLLEHLYLNEAGRLLCECHRVLSPGGVLRIIVPDLRSVVAEYLKAIPTDRMADSISADTPADILNKKLLLRNVNAPSGNIFYRIYTALKDFHSHKWVYDAGSLIKYFELAGFNDVREMKVHESRIFGIISVEDSDRILGGIGVCIEGVKPYPDESIDKVSSKETNF